MGSKGHQVIVFVAGNGGKTMRLTVALSLFLMSVSAWAGTFTDDFEDGDWKGWEADAIDGVSVVDGVLRLDHINKPGFSVALSTGDDWEDYSSSANVRLVKTEPGATH